MSGRTVVRTPVIRVVQTRVAGEDRVALRGCAFATNRVVNLGEALPDSGTSGDAIRLDAHAGTWVGTSFSSGGRNGTWESTRITNLRNGRGYRLHSEQVLPGDPGRDHSLEKYELNDRGQVAAIFHDYATPAPNQVPVAVAARVAAVDSSGHQRVVDSGAPPDIPASSLTLDRRLFIWTHSGQVRYAWL
jgi:hypothetical protein